MPFGRVVSEMTRARTGSSSSPVSTIASGVMWFECFASSRKAHGWPVSSIWVGHGLLTFVV
jgi:hypothetical protein